MSTANILFSEDFETFTGAGFAPNPSAGQLDSDVWRVTGLQDAPNFNFGDTQVGNDLALGLDADGGVTKGGIYAFDFTDPTNALPDSILLGVQPTANDFTPGAIELKIENTTSVTLDTVLVDFDIYTNNDQGRGSAYSFSYSTDGINFFPPSNVFLFSEPADSLGLRQFVQISDVTLKNLDLDPGEALYLRWSGDDNGGSGFRDEFAIDNVKVTYEVPQPDLIISEIVEGTGDNQAIEIYNGTGADVDLSQYRVSIYKDGATTTLDNFIMFGTLAAGETFVIVNDDAGQGLLDKSNFDWAGLNGFDGNDVVVLSKNGGLDVVDSFGQLGVNPGAEWPGGSADVTLIRNADVTKGDSNPNDAFDTSEEWTAQPTVDDISDLGMHSFGPSGPQTVDGLDHADKADLRANADRVRGEKGDEVIDNSAGSTSQIIAARKGSDNVAGGSADDMILGGGGNDTVDGGGGNDILYGGNGNDTVIGGAGSDILSGDKGSDELTGGAGADSFAFKEKTVKTGGVDTITDFTFGEDIVGLFRGLTFDNVSFAQNGTSVDMSYDGNVVATFLNADVTEVESSTYVDPFAF